MLLPSRKASEVLGVHPNTLRKWADSGKLKTIRSPAGQRMYDLEEFLSPLQGRRKVCYCRVSSVKQKDDLDRQVAYLKNLYPEHEIITDIGSGLNFKRKGLLSLLESINSGEVQTVVVAHRDRLARFGFELIQWLAAKNNTELLVLDKTSLSPTEELTRDLLSIVHIFSCRAHGLRRYSVALKKDKDLPNPQSSKSVKEVDGYLQEELQHGS